MGQTQLDVNPPHVVIGQGEETDFVNQVIPIDREAATRKIERPPTPAGVEGERQGDAAGIPKAVVTNSKLVGKSREGQLRLLRQHRAVARHQKALHALDHGPAPGTDEDAHNQKNRDHFHQGEAALPMWMSFTVSFHQASFRKEGGQGLAAGIHRHHYNFETRISHGIFLILCGHRVIAQIRFKSLPR